MRVLLADDDSSTRKMLASVLTEWGYEVTAVNDGRQAWDLLRRPDAPRLAILDWIMPRLEGPEICRRVRQHETGRYTYIVLLTIRGQKSDLVQGIEAGADDYVTKPFDPIELKARLTAARRLLNVHEQLIAAQDAIRKEALRDPLTGVLNRAAILETLRKELERAAREDGMLALAMVDLDGFKQINDTYGHMAGDEVLLRVARALQLSIRSYDAIGRYGGDEFLIVLPGLSEAQARDVCQRLRLAVAQKTFLWNDRSMHVSVTTGLTVTEGASRVPVASLINAADNALYAAKRSATGIARPEAATVVTAKPA